MDPLALLGHECRTQLGRLCVQRGLELATVPCQLACLDERAVRKRIYVLLLQLPQGFALAPHHGGRRRGEW